MGRKNGSGGGAHTRRQTGLRNRYRNGLGTYSTKQKSRKGERYTRPYLSGVYLQWGSTAKEKV